MRAIMKHAIVGMGVAAMLGVSLYGEAKYGDSFDRHQIVQTRDGTVKVPLYNPVKMKPGMCSSYARQASEEMFGEKIH